MVWVKNTENFFNKKLRRASNIFTSAAWFILDLFTALLMGMSLSIPLMITGMGWLITSPEKSARMAWHLGCESSYNFYISVFMGTICASLSLFMTALLWAVLVGPLLFIATSSLLATFPVSATLLTTIANLPVMATILALGKTAILPFYADTAAGLAGLISFGFILLATTSVAIALRVSDEISDAWARWNPEPLPPKLTPDTVEVTAAAKDVLGKLNTAQETAERQDALLEKQKGRLDEIARTQGHRTNDVEIAFEQPMANDFTYQ